MKLQTKEVARKQDVRVVGGTVPSPKEIKYKILSQVEGLCAWVGKTDPETEKVIDCIPVFLDSDQERGPLTYGMVLLADIARDATVDNRFGAHNLSLGNADTLSDDIKTNYGNLTLNYLNQEFLSRKLPTEVLGFVSKRMARNLKMNFPEAASNIIVDGHRIRLEVPPTHLANPSTPNRMTSLLELATWLGSNWMEAERNLVRKMPELSTRESFLRSLDA